MKTVVIALVVVCVAAVTSVLLAFLAGGLGPFTAWTSLVAGLLAGGWTWISWAGGRLDRRQPTADGRPCALEDCRPISGWVEWSVIVVFALFALRSFCWLIFWKDGDIDFLSPNNLGDLSLHLTFIRYLANGAPFWPENPIFAGTGLHYPFGVDLFNSLLALVGVPVVRGLVWVGLLGALATAVALRRWGGPFAMAGFLFSGGVAGFAFFSTLHWDGGHLLMHLEDFEDHFIEPNGSIHSLAWKSIPLALFITQRGLLYAIPVGLTLLWSWRARFFRGQRALPFRVETLLYATLPLFHLHTFIALSGFLAFWFCAAFLEERLPAFPAIVPEPQYAQKEIVRLIAWAFLPATLLVWLLTGMNGGSVIHWKPGWMQDEPFFIFWFRNIGFLPLFTAALFAWLWLRRREAQIGEAAAFALPATLLFILTCFVMFAPWEWDNTKLMIWSYFVLLPPLWAMICRFPIWLRAMSCFLLFFSGFVSLLGGIDSTHQGYSLAERSELDSLSIPLRPIPITATFASFPTFNHPLLILGRKVAVGYPGHLGSHGIDYKPRQQDLESLLRGEPGWEQRARALGVDYLFWGSREQKEYAGSLTPWKGTCSVVATGEWGTLYDLRGLKRKKTTDSPK